MTGSASGSGVVIPPGYSPPFYQVTDKDHTAWIVIASALCLCWLLLFAAIRVFIRCTITPGIGFDDVAVAISTVMFPWSDTFTTALTRCSDFGLCPVMLDSWSVF
jgi:hypothetical protein